MTHYETIGIAPDAPHDAVQRAYRAAAKECHPDFHPGDEAKAERFKALAKAWAVLGDPEARAEYDAALAKGESPGESLMDAIRRFFGRGQGLGQPASDPNLADALAKLAEGVEDAAAAGEDAAVLVDLLREVGAGGIGALQDADDDEEPEVTLTRAGLLAFADFCRGGSGRSPLQEGPAPRAERRRRKKAGKR